MLASAGLGEYTLQGARVSAVGVGVVVIFLATATAAAASSSQSWQAASEQHSKAKQQNRDDVYRSTNVYSRRHLLQQGAQPSSGSSNSTSQSALPNPVATFALQGSSLSSNDGQYGGNAFGGADFVYDADMAMSVLECNAENSSYVLLDNVPYGQAGPFAMNIWFKINGLPGDSFAYMYSHNNTAPNIEPLEPNQIQVLLPEEQESGYGVVRTIVKDSTDAWLGNASLVWLDSDGQVANTTLPAGFQADTEGGWHMLTLTSQPAGGKGYQLWLDAALVGSLQGNQTYLGANGTGPLQVGGGAAMALGGNITLCARSDLDPARFYSGRLAQLSLFSSALTPTAILHMYMQQQPATALQEFAASVTNVTLPAPAAYFPFTDGTLADLVTGQVAGTNFGAEWVTDADVGVNVLECDKTNQSHVYLNPVLYGESGPFAISIWVKIGSLTGNALQYIYSHNNTDQPALPQNDPTLYPNEVQLYVPDQGHNSFGVIRAIVKDSSDLWQGNSSLSFLDSDGLVGDGNNRNSSTLGGLNVQDGAWHMLTLSTLPSLPKGFAMYIDGVLVGEESPNTTYYGSNGVPVLVSGGGPMQLNGSISLCSRADLDPQRFFSGRLAELVIFNSALSPDQVALLYTAGINSKTVSQVTPAAKDPVQEEGGLPLCSLTNAVFNGTSLCTIGLSCQALPAAQIQVLQSGGLLGGALVGQVGVCVTPLPGGVLLPSPTVVPPARAFFPLVSGAPASWPVPEYQGLAVDAEAKGDPVFGSALYCDNSIQGFALLDAVQYAAAGDFSVNVWEQAHNTSGEAFGYLFSHQAAPPPGSAPPTGWGPNQVQVYFPGIARPDLGILRTYVRDMADVDNGTASAIYVDSDGQVGDNSQDRQVLLTGSSGVAPPNGTDAMDGNWHMVTVTSQAAGGSGFRLYLDGQLAGQVDAAGQYFSSTGAPLTISGGGPMQLDGSITLCARSDLDPQRYFDGSLAYLGLYDYALTPSQVAALYGAVQPPLVEDSPALAPPLPTSVDITPPPNGTCELPLVYNNSIIRSCVEFVGQQPQVEPVCWVEATGWTTCSTGGAGANAPASAAQNVLQLAVEPRVSTAGVACVLPVVNQGVLLTDCVRTNYSSAEQCITASGWVDCAPIDTDPGYVQALLIANRTTTEGQNCSLPVVYQGEVFTDCLQDPSGGPSVCPVTSDDLWHNCTAAANETYFTLAAKVVTAAGSTGGVGQLCSFAPASVVVACQKNLTCIPYPSEYTTAMVAGEEAVGAGYCAVPPADARTVNVFDATLAAAIPTPLAFFPLAGGSLQTLTIPLYAGLLQNASFAPDSTFQGALDCSRGNSSIVELPPVPYAADGPFAINLWFKPDPSTANLQAFQYLFSQINNSTTFPAVTDANQVQLYLSDYMHPGYGVVRTFVKDSTDLPVNDTYSDVILDSDGYINYEGPRNATKGQLDLYDGQWHMLTVSSLPGGGTGYSVFVDGRLGGRLQAGATSFNTSTPVQVGGGAPIQMNSSIFLCSRADGDSQRHYSGGLTHLSLYDTALNDTQVAAIYTAYAAQGVAPVAGQQYQAKGGSGSGGCGTGCILGAVFGSIAGAALLALALCLCCRCRRKQKKDEVFHKFDGAAWDNGMEFGGSASPHLADKPPGYFEAATSNGIQLTQNSAGLARAASPNGHDVPLPVIAPPKSPADAVAQSYASRNSASLAAARQLLSVNTGAVDAAAAGRGRGGGRPPSPPSPRMPGTPQRGADDETASVASGDDIEVARARKGLLGRRNKKGGTLITSGVEDSTQEGSNPGSPPGSSRAGSFPSSPTARSVK